MPVRRLLPFVIAMTLSSAIASRAAADDDVGPRYSAESWLACVYDFYEPAISTSQLDNLVAHFDAQGMKHEAARCLADLRARDPYLADVAQADCDIRAGAEAKAEALLSAAIAAHQSRPDAFRLRVHLRRLQRDDDGYYADLNHLIARLDHRHFEHSRRCYERAQLLFDQKNYRDAATSASQAIESHIEHWRTIVGSSKLAESEYGKPPASFLRLRAASYAKLGRWLDAIADYDYCEAHGWDSPDLLLERAECYEQVGLLSKAYQDRARAKALAAAEKNVTEKNAVEKQAKDGGAEKIPVVDPSLPEPNRPEPKPFDPKEAKPLKPGKT